MGLRKAELCALRNKIELSPSQSNKITTMRFVKILFLFLAFTVITNATHAQSFLSGKDLSTVKVDALTDAEIAQIQAQLKKSGMTIDMVESQAIAKGMSAAEFAKLKTRLASTTSTGSKSPLTKKTVNKKAATDSTNTKFDDMAMEHKINPLIMVLNYLIVRALNKTKILLHLLTTKWARKMC